MTSYTTLSVPVRGGQLAAGLWRGEQRDAPAVLALHGITASHVAWQLVAERLDGIRLIAPDLRGRGRSNSLPGPYGMAQHAEDLAALLDAQGIDRVVVVAHSMGAFVAMVFAHRYPERVSELVLVDGGIPLAPPQGERKEETVMASLGPAAERLAMTFASRQEYREFWMKHPAFAGEWSDAIADYVDYDLVGAEPELRSSAHFDAVAADSLELRGEEPVATAWRELRHPAVFLRAPRGLMNEPQALYAQEYVGQWASQHGRLQTGEVPDVNHYTIVMGPRGADAVAARVTTAVEARAALRGIGSVEGMA